MFKLGYGFAIRLEDNVYLPLDDKEFVEWSSDNKVEYHEVFRINKLYIY